MKISTLIIALPSSTEPFWRQVVLSAIGPLITVFLGGLLVTLVIRWIDRQATERSRQEEHNRSEMRQEEERRRSDLRMEEDRRRAEVDRNYQIVLELMKVAYGFYFRLIEVARVEQYEGEVRLGSLPKSYEQFRIEARVIEEQLRVYFPDGRSRWLWHGAVDMLSARYYLLAHPGPRLVDMLNTHTKHPRDAKIPESVRGYFLGPSDIPMEDRVAFNDVVLNKFEHMLLLAVNLVAHGDLDPHGVNPAIIELGRGSRLSGNLGKRPTPRVENP